MDSLKYFCQQRPDIAPIATGSNVGLLGSFPVDKVNRLTIRPMTFKEFLWANGLALLSEVLDKPGKDHISPVIHEKLVNLSPHRRTVPIRHFTAGLANAPPSWNLS
jgi:hypothetical protein